MIGRLASLNQRYTHTLHCGHLFDYLSLRNYLVSTQHGRRGGVFKAKELHCRFVTTVFEDFRCLLFYIKMFHFSEVTGEAVER